MDFVEGIESLTTRAELVADAIQFPTGEVDFGASGQGTEYLINEFKKIDKLTSDGYRDFVKQTLDRDHAVVVVFKPKASGGKGDVRAKLEYTARSDDRQPEPLVDPAEARKPLPSPRQGSVLGTAERYTLGNGMRVILLAYDGLPIVQAQLVLNAGDAFEPAGITGLADATARFLSPPADANYTYWVSLGSDVDPDHTTFWSRGLNIHSDVVIEALERTVKIGQHDEEALEKFQKRVRNRFKSADYRREIAFAEELAAALYGPDHPYTRKGTARPETVGNIGYDASTGFKREHYTARNAALVVVGNFDKQKVRAKIERTFGAWSPGQETAAVPATRPQRTGAEVVGVVGKDQQQMRVTLAYPAPAGRDGQYAARLVLTEMLNQQMAVIRTELGSTYGTYAEMSEHVGPNSYSMGGRIDSARAGESIKVMRDRIEALRRGDDLDRWFALARRQVLRQLLAESTDTRVMASRLASIAAFGLGPDYYDQLVKYVAAVSPAQVRAIIAVELRPELEVVVGMADRPTLEKAFREAGLARVRYVEPK